VSNLVFLEPDKIDAIPFTTSDVIAERTNMNHRRVKDSIRKHQTEIESFGLLGAYETESAGGRPVITGRR
jgi:phage regulator Rha-like protein